MTTLEINIPGSEYKITVGAGLLNAADKYFSLDRKVFIVTDSGVPREYAEAVKSRCKDATIYTVKEGEGSKSFGSLEKICEEMMNFGLSRSDCAVAVGGGVVGDLTGFAAAVYMRGIDFYNVPTTLLAQVDSSIGGKTAINLGKTKNIVGAFHQPVGVLIDTEVLRTLPKRHLCAGLAESVKMSLTSDKELFRTFETTDITLENIEDVIVRSLKIKKAVVELDEKEAGLRKVLNFGHTFGHCIEAQEGLYGLYHGECVALGMLPMCSQDVRARLLTVLEKLELPTTYCGNVQDALKYASHDKKANAAGVSVVFVDEAGSYRMQTLSIEQFSEHINNYTFTELKK